ncbi:hypothetical protein CTA1_7291 [Colletotrichum tanaceti]|uniref:Uncharacterized protein n=1 Tax=Colletotrichum tanaceti TaxID=1306861 RepID=A0A4U6XBP0_9PEZI|nr:hypothetical protein CTA1_7291 [Colletotrichum tanaceti]
MARRHRPSKRSSKHRQANLEPDFGLAEGRVINGKNHRPRSQKDGTAARRCRASSVPVSKPSRKYRHDRHTHRIAIETDTDGDFTMLPTPPGSPDVPPFTHITSKHEVANDAGTVNSRSSRHKSDRHLSLRHSKDPTRDPITSDQQLSNDATLKSFRFRHHILSLLDQQRTAVESWADSVGAGGPAEPMDWQPEQERVVYIARSPVEYRCYEDRWRVEGESKEMEQRQQQQQGMSAAAIAMTMPFAAQPQIGSWTGETPLDALSMWGTSAFGSGFLGEIE